MHSGGARCGQDLFWGGQSSLGGRTAPSTPPAQHGDPWGDHTAPGPPFPWETGAQNPMTSPGHRARVPSPNLHSIPRSSRGDRGGVGGGGARVVTRVRRIAGRELLETVAAPARGRWAPRVDASISGVNSAPGARPWLAWAELLVSPWGVKGSAGHPASSWVPTLSLPPWAPLPSDRQ